MSHEETMNTLWGEMLDMLSCLAIFEGTAKQKIKKKSFFEILELR
jgi:hypothetical protein